MVMPCSRSAGSPSASNDRSMPAWPRRLLDFSIEESWSSNIALVSYSSRPISVLLPSSTLPALEKRSMPVSTGDMVSIADTLKVSFLLAQLHRSFRCLVVHARSASFRDAGRRGFDDDLLRIGRVGFHRAGAGHVSHGTKPHRNRFDGLACLRLHQLGHRQQAAGPAHHVAPVRVIDRRNLQLFALDVLPHVELCPVPMCNRENENLPGRNPFSASRSITIESLPPENSSAGLLHSAATSRMM